MKFLLSLLNSENENVSELATSVISHSCDRTVEQKAILMLVFWKDLFSLLKGPSNQRQQLMSLEVLDKIVAALKHDSVPIRIAACMCIKSISRSVMGVAALEAICNVAIGFTHQNHPIFVQCRGVTQLVQLAKSMDSSIRFKSVCALGKLLFLADEATARSILSELTVSTLANLISDPELLIQKQALALTANFIDGHLDSIEYLLSDDSNIIVAIVRKLHSASSPELCFQGKCVLNNIAAGDESHIEAVMSYVIPYKLMNVPPLS